MTYLVSLLFILISSLIFASDRVCSTVEEGTKTQFHCFDTTTQHSFYRQIDTVFAMSIVKAMEGEGVTFISHGDFLALSARGMINDIVMGPNSTNQIECVENIYYRVDEFNELSSDHEAVERLTELARALQEAGVCDLPVLNQNFQNINIQTADDVLHQFLCISNSESVFGRDNLGMGGRGPWGIHPMHNLPAGSRVSVGGETITLRENGLCYPGRAIVRDGSNNEIRDNERYKNYAVRLDNARCAMRLYRDGDSGFRDWGTTNAWGSNRHCSANTRNRLQFMKHIGPLGCCTQRCLDRLSTSL